MLSAPRKQAYQLGSIKAGLFVCFVTNLFFETSGVLVFPALLIDVPTQIKNKKGMHAI